jgi:hypothetical protein
MFSHQGEVFPVEEKRFLVQGEVSRRERKMFSRPEEVFPHQPKMFSPSQKVFPEEGKMFSVQEEMFFVQGKLSPEERKMFFGQGEMFFGQGEMFFGQGEMFFGQGEMFLGQEEMFFGQGQMFSGQEEMFLGQEESLFGSGIGEVSNILCKGPLMTLHVAGPTGRNGIAPTVRSGLWCSKSSRGPKDRNDQIGPSGLDCVWRTGTPTSRFGAISDRRFAPSPCRNYNLGFSPPNYSCWLTMTIYTKLFTLPRHPFEPALPNPYCYVLTRSFTQNIRHFRELSSGLIR